MTGITTNYSYSRGNCFNAVDKLKGTALEGIGKSSEGSGLHGGEMEAHMRRYNPEKYEEYSRLKKQCEEEFSTKTSKERLKDAQNGVKSEASKFLEAYSKEQRHSNMSYFSEARQAYQDEVNAWTEEDVDYMLERYNASRARLVGNTPEGTNTTASKGYGSEKVSASLSVSKEDIDFLCSDKGFAKMKKDAQDLYAANLRQQQKIAEGRDPKDKFWNNTGDQWMTFSDALRNSGFYDNMSDDQIREVEGLLEQITSGMDRLSKSQYNTGIDFGSLDDSGSKFFMSSAEASVALESSTAALKYMSEKLIPDELKEDFNGLIDMYRKHNEEILSEYNNPMESFNKVVANINKMGSFKIAEKPVGEYKYTVMLGSIDKTEDEKKDFREQIADIFKRYGLKGDFTTTLDMIKKQFEDYASGNSKDKGFRQYVSDETAGLFDDMQKCWSSLMEYVNGYS